MEITLGFCFKGHVLEGSHQPLDKVGNMSVNSEAQAELRTSPNLSTFPKYYKKLNEQGPFAWNCNPSKWEADI